MKARVFFAIISFIYFTFNSSIAFAINENSVHSIKSNEPQLALKSQQIKANMDVQLKKIHQIFAVKEKIEISPKTTANNVKK